MTTIVDAVVVGMGPGGEEVAGRLAEAGLDVVGIEANLLGGECPYWGCIPSKIMVRAADALAEARRVPELAGSVQVAPDYRPVARRVREATDGWDDQVAVDRFTGKGGRFVRGTARLAGPGLVEVAGETFRAEHAVVVATGTKPAVPPVDGLGQTPFWTNREAIEAEQPPDSLAILGGGAIGLELAQMFARFGTEVTVIELADRLLPAEDADAGALLAEVLPRDHVRLHTGAKVTKVLYDADHFEIQLESGEVSAQRLLVATGRRADLSALGVDSVGIDPAARWLPVDGQLRAGDKLWAVGDVTGKGAFTHVAMYQARIATADILGREVAAADYRALPRVTFTDPEIGAVGLTDDQAREQGLRIRVARTELPSSSRGFIHGPGNDGFIKLIEDADRGVLVGAVSAGPSGGEVLGALSVAVHAGVSTEMLGRMIYAYPTFHRAIEDALQKLG